MSNESVEVQSLRHHVMSSQPRSHQEMDVPPLFEDSKQVASPASPQPLPNLLFQRREKSDGDNVKKYPLYRHQVSGHFPILWNSAGTICKPVNSRELHFYSHLKEKFPMLLPFVPKFFGVMDFVAPEAAQEESAQPQSQSDNNNNHDNNGNGSHSKATGNGNSTTTSGSSNSKYQTITATSFIQSSPPIMSSINSAKGHIKIEAESLGPPMLSASASSSPAPEPVEEHIETETEHSSVKRKKSTVYNEWGSVCHEKKREVLSSGNVRYLVLEDLTRAYEKPCILDLKIGTQQHSDDDPPAKKQSKIAKCAKTTSASLGLRFSGSQVFDVSKGEYIFQDKYFGRSLDAPGLYAGLHDFFYNGVHFRRDVVRVLLRRLTDFRDVMKQERVFLFRSSSLLFVYEGVKSEPVDVESLFPQNSAAAAPAPTVVSPASPSSPLSSTSTPKDKPPSPALTKTRHNSLTQSPFPGFADVRFIDFAHIDDANGALDDGVLCGLNNLISALAHFLEVDNDEVAHVSPNDIGAVFTRSTSVSSSAPSTSSSTVLPHQQ